MWAESLWWFYQNIKFIFSIICDSWFEFSNIPRFSGFICENSFGENTLHVAPATILYFILYVQWKRGRVDTGPRANDIAHYLIVFS